jgi:hypothetical protein
LTLIFSLILTLRRDEQDACSTVEEQRFSAALKGKRVEQAFRPAQKEHREKPGSAAEARVFPKVAH